MLKREEMLCFSLGVAMRRISKIYAEALAGHEITPPQLFLLSCLEHSDGQKPRDLAEQVCLDASSLTGLLDRTERCGLIERRPDPEDRRALRIYLTDAGRATLGGLHNVVEEVRARIEREFFGDYSPEQRDMFQQMLTRMREVMA
jgi:MarR family transcriptional regulator, organic hydroperoxide resistance regulator